MTTDAVYAVVGLVVFLALLLLWLVVAEPDRDAADETEGNP